MKHVLSLFIFFSLSAQAGKIVGVTPENAASALVNVSHHGQVYYNWIVGDLICLSKTGKTRIVCGRVARYDNAYTVLRVGRANAAFTPGEDVKILYSKSKRKPASTSMASTTTKRDTRVLTTLGLGTGFSYLLFQGQLQYGVARRVSLGLTVPFAQTSDSLAGLTAIGALLSFNYYLVERFTGYNFELGLGKYALTRENFSNGQSTTDSPFSVYSTFGWKGMVNRGRFNLGVAGGVTYVGSDSTQFAFSGILPLIALTFGVEF